MARMTTLLLVIIVGILLFGASTVLHVTAVVLLAALAFIVTAFIVGLVSS